MYLYIKLYKIIYIYIYTYAPFNLFYGHGTVLKQKYLSLLPDSFWIASGSFRCSRKLNKHDFFVYNDNKNK